MMISGATFLTYLQTTSISIILRVGLVGVSIQRTFVSFLMALTTFSWSVMSTNYALIPWLSAKNLLMYLWVPP